MLYLISLPISRYHILKRKNVIAIIIIALHIFFFAPGSCGKWFQIFFPQSNFSKQARLMKNMNQMKPVIWITSYDSQRTALKHKCIELNQNPVKLCWKFNISKIVNQMLQQCCFRWHCGSSVSMGNQFSTDYSTTVGPILMISRADPMNFIPVKCWKKNNPLAHLWAPARKKMH